MKRKAFNFKNNLPLKPMSDMSKQNLIIPLYHTLKTAESIPYIDPLYSARTVKQFRADLDYFLDNFTFISLEELINLNKSGKSPKEKCFHITFDDGLKSFYNLAAPILKEKGISATCFLNNDFVGNKGLFYRYKVGLIIDRVSTDRQALKSLEKITAKDGFDANKSYLKSLKYKDTLLIDEILSKINLDVDAFLSNTSPYMNEEEILCLKNQGFTFGGHSRRHQDYQFLNTEEQIKETLSSTVTIAEQFNLKYKAFAFPFTDHKVSGKYFEEVKNKIDISFGTAGLKKREYGFHYHRIAMENNELDAKTIIKAEYLYYLLKVPFGKNSIQRK